MKEPAIFASLVAAFAAFAEALGLEREQILTRGGTDPCLTDPDELVSYEPLLRIFEMLVEAFPSAPIGARYASLLSRSAFAMPESTRRGSMKTTIQRIR